MDARLSSDAIFTRLGVAACNADFELIACHFCGRQSLVDHERLRIYPESTDLRDVFLNMENKTWPPCRGCGRPDWEPVSVGIVADEWTWACREG